MEDSSFNFFFEQKYIHKKDNYTKYLKGWQNNGNIRNFIDNCGSYNI